MSPGTLIEHQLNGEDNYCPRSEHHCLLVPYIIPHSLKIGRGLNFEVWQSTLTTPKLNLPIFHTYIYEYGDPLSNSEVYPNLIVANISSYTALL